MASDRDIMAAMAARMQALRGPSAKTFPSPNVPRSMPTSTSTTKKENVPPRTPAPAPATPAPAVTVTPPAARVQPLTTSFDAPTAPPQITERDTNTVNMGPALHGDSDALREARLFLQEASKGKIRSSRAGSSRIMSKSRDSVSSASSHHSSARDLFPAATLRPPAFTTSKPPPSPEPADSGWQNFSALHGRPPATTNAPRSPLASEKPLEPTPNPAFGTNTAAPFSSFGPTASPAAAPSTPAITLPQTPASPTPEKKSTNGLLGRQMADITNTVTGRSSDSVPPHLRAKKGTVKEESAAPPPASKPQTTEAPTNGATVMTNKQVKDLAASTTAMANPEVKASIFEQDKLAEQPITNGTNHLTEKPTSAAPGGTKAIPIVVNGNHDAKGSAPAVGSPDAKENEDKLMEFLNKLQTDVTSLREKVEMLEEQNIYLSQKCGELEELDKRRRFLGTDSAKAPYNIVVIYPNGVTKPIQVQMDYKVANVIRAARNAAGVGPSDTRDPHITFGKEQVGHSLTLGEVGIKAGDKVKFSFDGGKVWDGEDEEDEEL